MATSRLLLTAAAISCLPSIFGQEVLERTFCWNQDFRLSCSWRSILAVHDAYFTNDPVHINNSNCEMTTKAFRDPLCSEDIRASLNRRCSGMSHCHFNLTEDHRARQCYCEGVIVLRYACVPESAISESCNSKVAGHSGYIKSPGYPRFYPKVQHCTWTIEESDREKMLLSLLDIDTRPPIHRKVIDNCPDSLTIFEDFHKLKYVCGSYDNGTARPVESQGKRVHVDFTSLDFMPSRGFLLHFKVHGCPTLPPPHKGYMVHRNDTAAHYMCCKGHVFNETSSNSLIIKCVDNMKWNSSLPACVSTETADAFGLNNTRYLDDAKLDIVEVYVDKSKYVEEILIPTACVVGLVFGHVAAIILALKLRKKRKSSSTSEEDAIQSPLPSTTTSPQPTSPTQPVPSAPPARPTVAPRVLITDL